MSTVTDLNLNILQVGGKIDSANKNAESLKKQLTAKVITSIVLGIIATLSVVGMVALGGITATVISLGIEFAGLSLTAIFAIAFIAVAVLFVVSVVLWIIFGVVVSKAKGNNKSKKQLKTSIKGFVKEKTRLETEKIKLEKKENEEKEKELIKKFIKEDGKLLKEYFNFLDADKTVSDYEYLKNEMENLKKEVEKLSDSNEKTVLLEKGEKHLTSVKEQISYMYDTSPKTPTKREIPKNYFGGASPDQGRFNADLKKKFIGIKNKLNKEKKYNIEELKEYEHIDLKKSLKENLEPMLKKISEKLESLKEKHIKINQGSIFDRFETCKNGLKGKQKILYFCILAKRILAALEQIGKMEVKVRAPQNKGDISPVSIIHKTSKNFKKNPVVNSPITKKTTKSQLIEILEKSAIKAKGIVDRATPNFKHKIDKNEDQMKKIKGKREEIFKEIKRLRGFIAPKTGDSIKRILGDFSTHPRIKKLKINRARYYKILEEILKELKTYKV